MSIQYFQNSHLSTPLIGLDRVDHRHCKFYAVIDSPEKVAAINAKYGAGAATIVGNPTFELGRGVTPNANGDGVIFDFAIIDAANAWRGQFGSRGQLSVYLEKQVFYDNTDSGTVDMPNRVDNGFPGYATGSAPKSVGMPPFLSTPDFKNIIACHMGGNNTALAVRMYGTDSTNQVHNGLVGNLVNAGIHKKYQFKLHSDGKNDNRSHLAFSISRGAGSLYEEFIDGIPTIHGGWGRAAIASTFYKLGENHVACNKVMFNSLDKLAVCGNNATDGSTIGVAAVSDTGNPVYVYAIVIGSEPLEYKIHPDFRLPCSFGASYSHLGGIADSNSGQRASFWDNAEWRQIVKLLAANGYHTNFCRDMSEGSHTIAYRQAPFAYPTPLVATQQGSCPQHPGVDHLEDMLSIKPSQIYYTDGPNDVSLIRNSTDPALLAQWTEDQRRMFKLILESGAKVVYCSFMGTPFYDNDANRSWIPTMKWCIERGLELKDWVRQNMGDYYADRIEVEDSRPYFKDYLQAGDSDGIISTAPNELYEEVGTEWGVGMHPIYKGRELLMKARIAATKRLNGLE